MSSRSQRHSEITLNSWTLQVSDGYNTKGRVRSGSAFPLISTRRPEHHPGFVPQLLGQLLKATIFHTSCHAVLYTSRLKALFGTWSAQDTKLSGKRQESEVGLVIWQLLDNFQDLYSAHPCRPLVFLGAGDLARIATGAVFVVY